MSKSSEATADGFGFDFDRGALDSWKKWYYSELAQLRIKYVMNEMA